MYARVTSHQHNHYVSSNKQLGGSEAFQLDCSSRHYLDMKTLQSKYLYGLIYAHNN